MNKTSIEYVINTDGTPGYTWNPVTGCFHPCRNIYCYNTMKSTSVLNRWGARKKTPSGNLVYIKKWKDIQKGVCQTAEDGESYPYGFDPTFYPHKLNDHKKLRRKKANTIFVCDCGDLFGKWVPEIWISKILALTTNPAHMLNNIFLFLTKNPSRYDEFDFPVNCWLGTTLDCRDKAYSVFSVCQDKPNFTFVSFEPLLGPPPTKAIISRSWIIIGAQTGPGKVKPRLEWVQKIIDTADEHSKPIFIKNNLLKLYPQLPRRQEIPWINGF